MRVLQTESEACNMLASFAGNQEYQNIRQRVIRIVQYRPYKSIAVVGTLTCAILCLMWAVVWIRDVSYERYNENDVMFAYGYDGKEVTFFDADKEF